MSDEKIHEKEPAADKGRQSIARMLKGSVAEGWKVMEKAELVKDSKRQVLDGGLRGDTWQFIVDVG